MAQTQAAPFRIQANPDTDFLKLVAILSMACDHVGKAFFPDFLPLLVLGRLAFPIFAYCLVVGCLHTRNIKQYFLRLGAFALISQPIYTAANHPTWEGFRENWMVWNIFFTLILGLAAVYGLKERNWLLLAAALVVVCLWNFDYGINGVILMLFFYAGRRHRALSVGLTGFWLGTPLFSLLPAMGGVLDIQSFALLALPLIYIPTRTGIKVNKYLFYAFYPAHLLVIFLIRLLLGA